MATCYRHPDRETNVACSRCARPICPDCMTSTPVGMRCPECGGERTRVVRNATGAAGRSGAPATYALIALGVAAFVGEVAGGGGGSLSGAGKVIREGGLFGPAVADGEWYRIVTSAFLHAGIFHLGLNMFILYILGTMLEPAIGTPRFAGIYVVSILGGSFGALLLDPNEVTVGASGGVFGLMAAAFLIARHRGFDELASQAGFLVLLNLGITFVVPNISVGGHLGGLLGGGLAALLVIALERRRITSTPLIEAAGMVVLAAAAVAGALFAADSAGAGLL